MSSEKAPQSLQRKCAINFGITQNPSYWAIEDVTDFSGNGLSPTLSADKQSGYYAAAGDLVGGQSYTFIMKVKTQNGIILPNTEIWNGVKVTGTTLSGATYTSPQAEDSIKITSSGNIAISKTPDVGTSTIARGTNVNYTVTAQTSSFGSSTETPGSLIAKPGSTFTITDTLPIGSVYQGYSVVSGIAPIGSPTVTQPTSSAAGSVVWTFTVPSQSTLLSLTDGILTRLNVVVKLNTPAVVVDASNQGYSTNTVSTSLSFLDSSSKQSSSSATTNIAGTVVVQPGWWVYRWTTPGLAAGVPATNMALKGVYETTVGMGASTWAQTNYGGAGTTMTSIVHDWKNTNSCPVSEFWVAGATTNATVVSAQIITNQRSVSINNIPITNSYSTRYWISDYLTLNGGEYVSEIKLTVQNPKVTIEGNLVCLIVGVQPDAVKTYNYPCSSTAYFSNGKTKTESSTCVLTTINTTYSPVIGVRTTLIDPDIGYLRPGDTNTFSITPRNEGTVLANAYAPYYAAALLPDGISATNATEISSDGVHKTWEIVGSPIPNYNGSGKTLYRFKYYGGLSLAAASSLSPIKLEVAIPTSLPGNKLNIDAFFLPSPAATYASTGTNGNSMVANSIDIAGDGNTTRTVVSQTTTFYLPASANGLVTTKQVQGDRNSDLSY